MVYLIIALVAFIVFSVIHPRPEDRDLYVISLICTFLIGSCLTMVYLQHIA